MNGHWYEISLFRNDKSVLLNLCKRHFGLSCRAVDVIDRSGIEQQKTNKERNKQRDQKKKKNPKNNNNNKNPKPVFCALLTRPKCVTYNACIIQKGIGMK